MGSKRGEIGSRECPLYNISIVFTNPRDEDEVCLQPHLATAAAAPFVKNGLFRALDPSFECCAIVELQSI